MSTSIISATNPHKGTTTSSAFAYALDDVVRATITNPAGGLLTPCQATLQLSCDGGVTFVSIDSKRGGMGDGTPLLLLFRLADYASRAVWTHGRLVFSGNTASTQLGVAVSAAGDGATWASGGVGSGTVTSVSVVTANGYSGTVANPTTTPAITISGPAGGSGTVTSVSVVTANGVSGTVATATTTPAITLLAATQAPGDNSTNFATTAFVAAAAAPLTSLAPFSLLGNPNSLSGAAGAIGLGTGLGFSGSNLTATGGGGLTPTATKTANYNAAVGDYVIGDATAGDVIVTLPAAPANGSQVAVRCLNLTGGYVRVATSGSDVFDRTGGMTTFPIPLSDEAIWFQYRTSGAIWFRLADSTPIIQLDGRYIRTGTTTGWVITQHAGAIIVPPGTSGTINLDLSLSDYFAPAALTGTTTFTFSNPPSGQRQAFFLHLIPGGKTVNWPGTVLWPGGTAPTLTATAGKIDVLGFVWDGASYLGSVINQNY